MGDDALPQLVQDRRFEPAGITQQGRLDLADQAHGVGVATHRRVVGARVAVGRRGRVAGARIGAVRQRDVVEDPADRQRLGRVDRPGGDRVGQHRPRIQHLAESDQVPGVVRADPQQVTQPRHGRGGVQPVRQVPAGRLVDEQCEGAGEHAGDAVHAAEGVGQLVIGQGVGRAGSQLGGRVGQFGQGVPHTDTFAQAYDMIVSTTITTSRTATVMAQTNPDVRRR
jgi:hypothetical protein